MIMIETNNSSTVTVEKMVRCLSNAYVALIKGNIPFRNFPSVMLWGPPGVGKSQGVREIAASIAKATGKKVSINVNAFICVNRNFDVRYGDFYEAIDALFDIISGKFVQKVNIDERYTEEAATISMIYGNNF